MCVRQRFISSAFFNRQKQNSGIVKLQRLSRDPLRHCEMNTKRWKRVKIIFKKDEIIFAIRLDRVHTKRI